MRVMGIHGLKSTLHTTSRNYRWCMPWNSVNKLKKNTILGLRERNDPATKSSNNLRECEGKLKSKRSRDCWWPIPISLSSSLEWYFYIIIFSGHITLQNKRLLVLHSWVTCSGHISTSGCYIKRDIVSRIW